MPAGYEDQLFTVDRDNPPAVGTALTFQRVEYVDEDDDGNIRSSSGGTWNGNAIERIRQDDTLTINAPAVGNLTDFGPTCFTPDTMTETLDGPRSIETSGVGELVQTMVAGAQPLRMILDDTFRAAVAAD